MQISCQCYHFLDYQTMSFTLDSERIVAICSLTFNSVGIQANFSIVKTYDEIWLKMSEIEIMNKQLIFSHNGGVSLIDLESSTVSQILPAQFLPKYLAAYKDGFPFTSKHCLYFWKKRVWNYFQVKQQKRKVEMVRLYITAFMKPQVLPLSFITSHMFAIEVLVLLKS